MPKTLKNITFLYLIIFLVSACSVKTDLLWIKTDDNTLLWIAPSDKVESFSWRGETIDSIAHGSGILSSIDKNGKETISNVNMFYGASSLEDIITMDDGSRYVGALVDDKMEGFGVLVKSNEVYIGTFHESKPDGFLKLYRNSKLYYEGNWKDGTFNGEGTLYKEDGNIKKGTWKSGKLIQSYYRNQTPEGFYDGYVLNGKPDGIGSMLYNDSSRYEGSWDEGVWSGNGTYYTKSDPLTGEFQKGQLNGTGTYKTSDFLYDGEWLDNKPDGIGYALTNDSSFYTGSWADGKRNGYGDMMFANGYSYFGDWNDNQFDGLGTYTYAQNGDSYYGEWKEGLQNGLGTYKAKDFEYTGNWEEGWINGEGRIIYSNKDFYEGNFVENERYGVGYYQFSNGNSYEGEFVNGKFNGLGIFRFADGNVYEGEFHNGKIEGDGTLYYTEGNDTIAITAHWDGSNHFPKYASVLFGNGDLYEGELVNGFPTQNGTWTTANERESGETNVVNSLNKANEFYKKHKEKWGKIVNYTNAALTVVTVAVPAVTPVTAPILLAVNATDAAIKTASAGIDTYNAIQNGADATPALTNLASEASVNVAFIILPKALKKLPIRKAKVLLSVSAKNIRSTANKSLVVLSKNKTFGRMIKITKDKSGALQKSVSKSTPVQMAKNLVSSTRRKFESAYLASVLPKTLIYKELKQMKAKGPIKLKKKDLDYILSSEGNAAANLRHFILTYTGNKKNFLEFFIRLSDGDKEQVAKLLKHPKIRKFVDNSIRNYDGGGKHEWLMTKNFTSFLLDNKWGKDGQFLAVALTRLTQKTKNLNYNPQYKLFEKIEFTVGGHQSSGRLPSKESKAFHDELSKIIDNSQSKEELFVNIRAFAKKALTKEAYVEFNEVFKNVLQIADK